MAAVAYAWMPGAGRVECTFTPEGPFHGGAPRAVWRTTESDPAALSARSVAEHLDSEGRSTHLVWNPLTGEVAQLLPATAPASGELLGDGTDRAHEGRACVIVTVVGRSDEPFTDGPLKGIDPILRWLAVWGVARAWPPGPPPAAATPVRDPVAERAWGRSGHFGASQVPGVGGHGPGAIDVQRLLSLSPERPRARLSGPRGRPAPLPGPAPQEGSDNPLDASYAVRR
ncbi:hypothetical protein [Nocardiopsis baichengensis]|uniref:hypothetical protein n=1 Tax=Nocardiopsis baichengensis TaxID=280240 RepID=UPI000372D302